MIREGEWKWIKKADCLDIIILIEPKLLRIIKQMIANCISRWIKIIYSQIMFFCLINPRFSNDYLSKTS